MKLSIGRTDTKKYAFKAAALAFLAAAVSLLPFVIAGGGALLLSDDFNYQQVVFNILCGNSLKNGNFAWSWYTDLGSSVIGSYSFYNLASPFSLFTAFLPAAAVPYATAFVLAVKYCVAALTAFFYIKRFVKNPDTAVFGSFLYAFSGFQTMNLLFPFHDVTALFPLMLIAVEKIADNPRRSRGLLAFASALMCAVNYYFFFGQIVFLVIYFIFRFIRKGKENIKRAAHLALCCCFEGLLGVGIAGIVFVPSALSVLQNPRLVSSVSEVLFHWSRYFTIAQSCFLPGDVMGSQSYFLEKACTSCAVCLPLVAMSFVFAYVIKNQKRSLTVFMASLAVIACVPLFNSAFSMFNAHYYARWFYMSALIFALASAIATDKSLEEGSQKNLVIGTAVNTVITLLIVAAEFLLIAFFTVTEHPYLEKINITVTALYAIFALACCVALLFVLKIKNNKKLLCTLTASVLLVSVITTAAAVYRYKQGFDYTSGYDSEFENIDTPLSDERTLEILTEITAEKLSLPDDLNYRIRTVWYKEEHDYVWHSYDNLSMTIGVPSVNSFISTVSGGIFEFYEGLGIERNVTTVENDDPALSVLLSCRYYLTSDASEELADGKEPTGSYTHSDGTTIYVFEYDDFLPFGFAYDYYITESELDALPEEKRAYALLCAVAVEDNFIETLSESMLPFGATAEYVSLLAATDSSLVSEEDISAAADRLSAEASTDFSRTDSSFSCTITSSSEKLAYFSIPCDSGWTASVNGKAAKIINSNGMIAVEIGSGVNYIEFSYETPGLKAGAALTVLCFASAVLYAVSGKKNNQSFLQKQKKRFRHNDQ